MNVILDTNFLVYCAKQKIDYREGIRELVKGRYELVVPNMVKDELRELEKNAKKYRDKQAASLALQILLRNKVKTIKIKGKTADEGIVRANKSNIIASNDKELLSKIEKGIIASSNGKISFS